MAIRHCLAVFAALAAIPAGAAAASAAPRPGPSFVEGRSCEAVFAAAERCEVVDGRRQCRIVRRFVGYSCVHSQG
jgi:hypothetical protein